MKEKMSVAEKRLSRVTPHYNDGLFRITIIVVVSLIVATYGGVGIVDSFSDPDFYLEFVATLAITAFLTEWIARVTRMLDRGFDWEDRFAARLLLQIALGVALPAVFEVFLATLWFKMIGTDIRETTFMNYALTLIVLLMIIFNSYYFVLYIYFRLKSHESISVQEQARIAPAPAREIPVSFGGETKYIPTADILFVYRLGKHNYLKTIDQRGGVSYVTLMPLDEVEKKLESDMFFRLNRQLIARRTCCAEYMPLRYGKLEVALRPASPIGDAAIVSQRRAPAFKKWIEAPLSTKGLIR